MDTQTLLQITVSLGLGLLLGLQRQRTHATIGGIRTFPFIALMGTVCGRLAAFHGGWVLAAGFLSLAALLVTANLLRMRAGEIDPGMTTEVAALLLFGTGALLAAGDMALAAVLGGLMVMLLHLKKPMHDFAAAVGDEDMRAIMLFVVISLIILPVLPNRFFGPYLAWNPFSIWLMVVLIVGISLGGYVAWKFLGERSGAVLGGILGGMVSSTATTVSFARRTAAEASLAPLGAFVITTASCVSMLRVIVEIAVTAPALLLPLAAPVAALLAVSIAAAFVLYQISRRQTVTLPPQKNPAELKAAIVFGGLYALVLVAVAAAREQFGSAGLYTVAAISGLTDVDAITLTTSQLAHRGQLDTAAASRTIVIAIIANLTAKFLMVAIAGSAPLTKRMAPAFGITLLAGAAVLRSWPS
ncbi:MAG: MgtC/SapB family protein [Verrucomicrobiota bacterium]